MLWQILMLATLVTIALLIWRVVTLLRLAIDNQVEQAISLLTEIEHIRAGLFAVSRIQSTEGWPQFDALCADIVKHYTRPQRLRERIEGEGYWEALRQG